MFTTLFKIALLATPLIQGVLADFAISTPKFTQCQDAQISWENTNGPYNLIVVDATDPCGDPLVDLGDHLSTQITWKVALLAGRQVQLSVEDAKGDEAWSGTITVDHSDDNSCVKSEAAVVQPPSGSPPGGSTVVVTPTLTVGVGSTPSGASPSAVGAANAGTNPLSNAAPSLRQASTPIKLLGAFAAVLAASL